MPRRSKRLKEKDESVESESQHRVESHAMTNIDIGDENTDKSVADTDSGREGTLDLVLNETTSSEEMEQVPTHKKTSRLDEAEAGDDQTSSNEETNEGLGTRTEQRQEVRQKIIVVQSPPLSVYSGPLYSNHSCPSTGAGAGDKSAKCLQIQAVAGSGTSCSRPSVVSYLHYGNTGPSCQPVCLVTEPDGQKTYTGVSFISLFSKQLATLLKDCQFQDELPTIIVPVSVDIIQKLLKFLSIGTVMCGDIENAFSIGKAADVLGITHENWKIETFPLKPVEVSAGYSVSYENHSECNIADIKIEGQDINANLKYSKESRKFLCSLCKASFKKMSHLNIHMQTHRANDRGVVKSRKFEEQAVDVFSCDVCGKCYTTRGSFTAHQNAKHSTTHAPLQLTSQQCPICKKTLRREYLGQHLNQHLPDIMIRNTSKDI
eukprot:GFUD01021413.1.p1 GENE.GFUD01021413.1~~GFUD01021413.1.p1  ORF type:complete len:432 (+),score=83.40 GFUD01021413.1:55-1350(+)